VVFTIITGIIYPLALVGLSQVAFSGPANGSLISFHGRIIGSSLLCQEFVDAKGNPLVQYFQPRPSAAIPSMAPKGDFGCDPTSSAASNFGPNNPTYIALIKQRQKAISAFDHVPISKIPSDAVTASGSGLDPDISQADAAIQVDRIATARHISPAQVRALVGQNTTGRTIGFLGQPVVNVLLLNRALDAKYPV
jgi:K+-transporting ATPase ATPase C chain